MAGLYFEAFEIGQEFHHEFSRTVTEMDNTMFSLLTMNPQPLHIDAHFAENTEFGQRLFNSIYTLGIIFGAVFWSGRIGVYSLPAGVLLGVALGPGLLTAIGAFRNGLHYTPVFSVRHPAFREWLRLNLPLMLGFTVGMADKWILAYFASADTGGISRLTVAKSLFNAPLTVIGAAAGAAGASGFFAAAAGSAAPTPSTAFPFRGRWCCRPFNPAHSGSHKGR